MNDEIEECRKENTYNSKCNSLLLKYEKKNHDDLKKNKFENLELYPFLDDPNFNLKIANKDEFSDNKYDGSIHDVEQHANKLINSGTDVYPHQIFVHNYMSLQTPFNSLLLFHELGTGKTRSAIEVCEEMRIYLKQIGSQKKIYIVANPNVQENFRTQLFDKSKLEEVNGTWVMGKGGYGSRMLSEINPSNMKNIPIEKIMNQIKSLISSSYEFVGYVQLSNMLSSIIDSNISMSEKILKLNETYSNTIMVIDEVHNTGVKDASSKKNIYKNLFFMVSVVKHLKLLLMSATPMFNSYKEIIWILNLMNLNDKRGIIKYSSIFGKDGEFTKDGKELFIRKLTGYVSYVRGQNPYLFPYRVYPELFSKKNSIIYQKKYPKYQINGVKINNKIKKLDLYTVNLSEYQQKGYLYITNKMRDKLNLNKLGYSVLQLPLKSLIMIYPFEEIDKLNPIVSSVKQTNKEEDNSLYDDDDESGDLDSKSDETIDEQQNESFAGPIVGTSGLIRTMDFQEKASFKYKNNTINKWGRIFSQDNIGKYSSKIKEVCEAIKKSEGIILIYSNYIDSGLIPMALALEEMGFRRFNHNNLFEKIESNPIDSRTMTEITNKKKGTSIAKYTMITGDIRLSPHNSDDIKHITKENNIHGDNIKVVLISRAGSEGIDFKVIRQIHVLEPWYNINRIEQIIGRGIRNMSHKLLPYSNRNVQIFMYASKLSISEEETVDYYLYRFSELKAIKIGKITRLLKENAIDCLINKDQTNFTTENLNKLKGNRNIKQILSDGTKLNNFEVGDKPNTSICDYMDNCEYSCECEKQNTEFQKEKEQLYSEKFIDINLGRIIDRVKDLMKDRFFYKKKHFIQYINIHNKYTLPQIYHALSYIIDNKEPIIDKYNRIGKLVNINDYYLFHPDELVQNNSLTVYERSVPLLKKTNKITLIIDDSKKEKSNGNEINLNNKQEKVINSINELYNSYKFFNKHNIGSKQDYTWYHWANIIIEKNKDEYGIDNNLIEKILSEHIFENLSLDNKVTLLNYFEKNQPEQTHSILKHIKDILNKKIVRVEGNVAIGIISGSKRINIFILNNDGLWEPAKGYDAKKIEPIIINRHHEFIKNSNVNKYVGFMEYDKKDTRSVYKIRDLENSRNKGFRCDQSNKVKLMDIMNIIENTENKYTKTNTKENVSELCVKSEIIMRIFNNNKKDGKIWFLEPETMELMD